MRKVVEPLFHKHNIDIDLTVRGVEENPFAVDLTQRPFLKKVKERLMYIAAKYFGI